MNIFLKPGGCKHIKNFTFYNWLVLLYFKYPAPFLSSSIDQSLWVSDLCATSQPVTVVWSIFILKWGQVPSSLCRSVRNNNNSLLFVCLFYTYVESVQFSRSVVYNSLWPHEWQHASPPCPSPTPGVHSNTRPTSQWCHPAISCSVVPFSSCPQSPPASGSFPMSQLFAWGGQSIRVSALASILPMNTQDWSLEWTGWISLQSMGLSKVFSNTKVQKHQFFGAQLSSQSNSHIHTWQLEKQ